MRELHLLTEVRCALALGRIALDGLVTTLGEVGWKPKSARAPKFGHGVQAEFEYSGSATRRNLVVFASYHPSQQNTFTGRLTAKAFDEVLGAARYEARRR